jgi:hypothetical protein
VPQRGYRPYARILNKGLLMQGRPETCGGPRSQIIRCLLKPIFFELYDIGQTGQANILKVADNFRRNSFACVSTIPTEPPKISGDFD